MRKPLIGGNWKMHKGIEETRNFARDFLRKVPPISEVDIFITPPFTSLPAAIKAFDETGIEVGAQNMYFEEEGAFTGEISPLFLEEMGVKWVILGHSERRKIFKESNEIIRKKVDMALRKGLKVVICIGETEEERDSGREKGVVESQLNESTAGIDLDPGSVSIAYEPVWAIGTGKTAKPEDAEEMQSYIRELLGNKGDDIRIMYGGSVKPHNAEELLMQNNIDGALIGGASLNPESFSKIIEIARGLEC